VLLHLLLVTPGAMLRDLVVPRLLPAAAAAAACGIIA
jgi:hypothetical protein